MDVALNPELLSLDFNYWILQTIAMLVTAVLIPGLTVNGPFAALITVLGIAFINTKIWDAALFFALPDTLSTQAGLLILVNALIFWIVVKILPGIEIKGIIPAIAAPLVFSISSFFISQHGKDINWREVGQVVAEEFTTIRGYFENKNPPAAMNSVIEPSSTRTQ